MSSTDYERIVERMWSCGSINIPTRARDDCPGEPSCTQRDYGERVAADVLVSEDKAEDSEPLEEFLLCRRPGVASGGKAVKLQVNCVELSVDSTPSEIFVYHVAMARSNESDKDESRWWRLFPRALMRRVFDAVIWQYEAEFGGVQVVHDGTSLMYSPVLLPWTAQTKMFRDVDPNSVENAPGSQENSQSRVRTGLFVVSAKLVDVITTKSLTEYYSNPNVDAMPALQALGVILRCLARQRLVSVQRNFFSIDDEVLVPLCSGTELRWGYHQAVRVADHKLLLTLSRTTTRFYSPNDLMTLVTATLNVRSPSEISLLLDWERRKLARALRRIEVTPTHCNDSKRCIYSISTTSASETMVNVWGKTISVVEYFSTKYNIQLQHPNLPLVNIGSKRCGRENWLPIELCEVASGQRTRDLSNLETAEVTKQIREFANISVESVVDQIRRISFDDNPYLDAFGVKLAQHLMTVDAHVINPPEVQYANVSSRPVDAQWNLRGKKFVDGAVFRNWGVVVLSSTGEDIVRTFVFNFLKMGDECGMSFENIDPFVVRADRNCGVCVEELMEMCFEKLKLCDKGPPQLIIVIKPDKCTESYGRIKRMSDTVLGIPSQCVVSSKILAAKPHYYASLCLKINMKLGGRNAVVRELLPFASTSATVIIGANVEHVGRWGKPPIASFVASLDSSYAKYVARVAQQKAPGDVELLSRMLHELLLTFYQATGQIPQRVVYCRGGASQDQYFGVLQAEMKALRKAFKLLSEDCKPRVTFIAVNKRHHLRAFPMNSSDESCVEPGTIIDTGVVDAHGFDFYLYGHKNNQGTSIPCHYTVLHDENALSAEDVHRLTFHTNLVRSRLPLQSNCRQHSPQSALAKQTTIDKGVALATSDSRSVVALGPRLLLRQYTSRV